MKYIMKPKVRELADTLVDVLSKWPLVETICLNEAASTDTLDPYFALILDVYVSGDLPSVSERVEKYPAHSLFEVSPNGNKDRFLVGQLPVRIEYKNMARIEELAGIALRSGSDLWKIRDSGTYGFYRLVNGQPLFERTDWHSNILNRLEQLPDFFWTRMRSFYQSTMDHYLNDLGAAIIQNDSFHYMVSAAGFIKAVCATLFMENGLFEPSHRGYFDQVHELTTIPDDFIGRFDSFLRPDSELPPERKYEIAKLIAKSIVGL